MYISKISSSLKKFIHLRIPFLAILFSFCISLTTYAISPNKVNTKPEKYTDPFIEMRQELSKFNQWIDEEEENTLCAQVFGNQFLTFYKYKNTPLSQLREKKQEEIGSQTFQENMNNITLEIKKAVDKFSINNHACSSVDFNTAKIKLEDLLDLQKTIFPKTQLDSSKHNKYKKENDETDPGFFTFTQTTKAFNEFITKKNLIVKAIADLKKGEISPEYDFRLTESERNRISQRAKERADSYTDDFVQAAREYIYTPILRDTIHVKKDLESLPNGRSDFDNFTYLVDYGKIISDMLSPTAKKDATKKVVENIKKNNEARNEFTENNIFLTNTLKTENEEYQKKLEETMQLEEDILSYDQPFSDAVVNSLVPFHVTLLETERLLNYQTDNLKYVLNRQNVEVD